MLPCESREYSKPTGSALFHTNTHRLSWGSETTGFITLVRIHHAFCLLPPSPGGGESSLQPAEGFPWQAACLFSLSYTRADTLGKRRQTHSHHVPIRLTFSCGLNLFLLVYCWSVEASEDKMLECIFFETETDNGYVRTLDDLNELQNKAGG